jgi:hypothetical protein
MSLSHLYGDCFGLGLDTAPAIGAGVRPATLRLRLRLRSAQRGYSTISPRNDIVEFTVPNAAGNHSNRYWLVGASLCRRCG